MLNPAEQMGERGVLAIADKVLEILEIFLAIGVGEGRFAGESSGNVEMVNIKWLINKTDGLGVRQIVQVEDEIFAEVELGVEFEMVFFDNRVAKNFVADAIEATIIAKEADNVGFEWFVAGEGGDGSDAKVGARYHAGAFDSLNLDTTSHQIAIIGLDGFDHRLDHFGRDVVIGIKEHDEFATRLLEADVAGVGWGAMMLLCEQNYSGILDLELANHG